MDSKLDIPAPGGHYESDVSEGYDDCPPAYRRDSESSTERSLYDEKDEALFASQAISNHAVIREYGWYHPRVLSRGLVIMDDAASTPTSKAPLYYVEVSEFTPKKPDVILHAFPHTTSTTTVTGITHDELDHLASTGESGPVVGVARFPKLSRHITVGLGDPSFNNSAMTYIEVRNANLMTHGEYHMTLDGRSYAWKRTHSAAAGVEGSSNAARLMLHRDSFQLVDTATNETIAVFLDNRFKSWRKKGKLRILKDLDVDGPYGPHGPQPGDGTSTAQQRLKLLVLVSIAAILEKARRRRNRRNNGGGGGGGP
ncbi:uncharacterized protein Z520_00900 [Fonsecaea multimorphosa CBS 102226]|uniref:Uncharacterized protein n=1 Tax=Fonsecaea multimorphosa CBS 102226 TaxID=1442371 RepID=A0A0D2J432_9EURO|nr:uncharacterized protein Z520_00900 [Fonsecaea multimorphosa CBS 102226]KIY04207.1 hypothetical protein Z520_00900 [Fonsecaea multimorphosa CBS 102226]